METFRQEIIESDFNRMLPGIIEACCSFCGITIEKIFTLDDDAKEYLLKHTPELLKKYGGADIQKFISDTKTNINNSLQSEK